jgi:hypothetical protein
MPSLSRPLLGDLPYLGPIETRSISAENPTGAKGGAATRIPDPSDPDLEHSRPAVPLGRGWKVRPFVRLPAHETLTLADIEGPGTISHVFLTSDIAQYRRLTLRMYWDGEATPSVEAPLNDFFALGHDGDTHTLVTSLPITVAPRRGLSSYWPMPFRERARITLSNDGDVDAPVVAYNITWHPGEVGADAAYFHAQWRRSTTTREHPEHVILDGVAGRGHYVGTSLAWTPASSGWWGEGEVKFFLDGDTEFPTIAHNGTEDYFGGAWAFYGDAPPSKEVAFSSPFLGLPVADHGERDGQRRFSMYRWHIADPIGFLEDIKVTVQALGWYPDGTYQPLTDDVASLAVWYQTEPHGPFPTMPPLAERWGR